MSPRERLLAALRREKVDRVPVMEMGIDRAVIRGLGFRGYLAMIEGLDLDGVAVNQLLYEIGWRRFILPHVKSYTDEWGVRYRLDGELLPIPVGHPIPAPSALERYRAPSPRKNPLLGAVRRVRSRFPDRAVVVVSRNDFSAAWHLCGMTALMMAFIDDPKFAFRLVSMAGNYYRELFRLCIAAGADVVVLTDDYAYKTGTLMSREHFTRFVLPELNRSVGVIREAGALCVKHTDGDISGIMDLIVDTGVDAIGPLEPAAGNDLAEIQKNWGDRVALVGNIDVDLLSRGGRAEVMKTTASVVRSLAGAGGHVLSSGNTITSAVNPKNFVAMVESGRSVRLE